MKKTILIMAAIAVLGTWSVSSEAATMGCTAGSGGSATSYTLTDALDAECFSGNDTNTIDSSFSVFGMTGWVLADKNDDSTSGDQAIVFTDAVGNVVNGTQSGNWAISSIADASKVMVNLKAGSNWASFLVDTTAGTWTSSRGLSHASIYYIDGMPAVPLPAAGWMLLAGVGGLVAVRRRRKA
jgi:hypothetical protein